MARRPSPEPDLFGETGAAPAAPAGFAFQPDLITPAEEAELVRRFAGLDLKPFEFRGYLAARRTAYAGWRYDHNGGGLQKAADLPDWILPLRARIAAFANEPPEAFAQVLFTEYAPGAGIGWHRDRPQFGKVAGLSLLSDCILRLRRRRPGGFDRISAPLPARSAYVMDGEVRDAWEHSITPMTELRYSVTFRTMRAA